VSAPAPRIACLVPSVTELLAALGLAPCLVARTGFCIHPADGVAEVPKVGGTKDVNLAKLRQLAPTHVLVNVDENTLPVVQALRSFVPEVIVTHPCSPHDVLTLIDQLAIAFQAQPGVAERARALSDELFSALQAIQGIDRPHVPVLYLIWRQPWMTVARDTYIARMLACVNWHTAPDVLGGEQGAARYPVVQGTEPWLADVQQVLLSSEPYAFDASHLREAQALCPNAKVALVDGELLSWYGPRTAAGLRYAQRLARGVA
jgi:ABC-type Fe3+-hydroxamate transport system substrate-binding protein